MNTPQDNWENLNTAVKSVRLSDAERSAGREKLASFMALTPRRHTTSFRARFFGRAAAVSASATALALSLAGVSFAAESSLPGDTLYPVKVSVNEEVRTVLTTSEASKAKWETEKATRRLGETEALAKKGTLTEKTREELDKRFKAHAERAKQATQKLRLDDNEDDADSTEARLEGSVRAHERIIEAIAEEKQRPIVVMTAQPVDDTEKISDKKKKEKKAEARKSSISKASSVAKNTKQLKKHHAIMTSISATRALLERAEAVSDSDSFGAVRSSLAVADSQLALGDVLAETDSKASAVAYREAGRAAQEAAMLIKASVNLKLRIDARKDTKMLEDDSSKEDGDDEHGDSGRRDRNERSKNAR